MLGELPPLEETNVEAILRGLFIFGGVGMGFVVALTIWIVLRKLKARREPHR